MLLQAVEVHFAGHAYLEALVLAILLGVALRTAWQPARTFIPGIAFSAKFLLECAVVMLGASVSVARNSNNAGASAWSTPSRSMSSCAAALTSLVSG